MAENKKPTLFDIHDEILALERLVEYNEGEMTDEHEVKLGELTIKEEEKLLSVGAWVKKLEMELAGLELHKKEVTARVSALKNLKERLRQWVWKGARLAGLIRGDEKKGWEGDKIANAQVKISWRRSEAVEESPEAQGFSDVCNKFPHFWDYELKVTEEGGRILQDLISSGLVEIKGQTFRKSVAAEYYKNKNNLPLSGIKLVKRINPQIK